MGYTIKDLEKNSKAYDENFKMLLKTTGTKEHKKYVSIEGALNSKDILLRKKFGLFSYDPCPLEGSGVKNCEKCTGWFKRRKDKQIRKKNRMQMSKEGIGFKCKMK